MLTIPFSHRYYAKWFDLGGIPLDKPSKLLNYAIARELSDDFRERDTKYWRGEYGIASRAEHFKLGPGPYLILFLATDTGNKLISDSPYAPGWIHWTTVRIPWGEINSEGKLSWIIPRRYRQARGQLVRIAYKPEEAK